MPIEYNHDHENEINLFGQVNFRNQFRRFGIKTDDRRRHMYVIGKTGVGKTTLMENMMLADILAGHGCCFVDPHGDTAEKLLDYIPSNRMNDVVYFNPADLAFPVGFNILETAREEQKHLVASGLMGVFKKIWPDVWSARMEYILLNCVLALLDYPGATLLGLSRILVDKDYRKRVVAKVRNPIVKTFWVAEFESWSEKYVTEAIAPVLNKVGQFLSASIVRNIVAQVSSTVNPRQIMDDGKILIANLSKGKIGEDNMRLLGGMLITKIQLAAMERVDIKHEVDRRDFYLYVDEFQNFANESFAAILSEARKYRLSLTVAHQYIGQLEEEVAQAIFGNVGTLISMRVGAEDAQFMENEFTPTFTPEDLVNLPKYNMYIKLMVDGVATQPFSAMTLPPIAKSTGSEQKVINVSRERFATARSTIEEKVLRWSGMEVSGGEEEDDDGEKKETSYEDRIQQLLKPRSEQKLLQDESIPEDGTDQRNIHVSDMKEPEEYLKISTERLESIRQSLPNPPKKQKPMFKHTCSRCGKVWEMPVQLDPSRPMFCNECMPIVKEERKTQKKAPPILEDRSKSEPNRPRIVGTVRTLPSGPEKEPSEPIVTKKPSLIDEISKEKGRRIETNKAKLGVESDRKESSNRKRKRKQKDSENRDRASDRPRIEIRNLPSEKELIKNVSPQPQRAPSPTPSPSNESVKPDAGNSDKKARAIPPAPKTVTRGPVPTATVFRSAGPRPVKPGQKVTF
ncbi:MAG: type IV secretion system DNA-binding domain-containing protein [bacterium]|nr:type IV secretion system DNA-binding domain-containing protein [bacterium]